MPMVGIVSSAVLGASPRLRGQVRRFRWSWANAGNDQATGKTGSRYITRVSFSNGQVNRPMGEWMARIGIKKVYTIAPDYAAGHQMIDTFSEAFKAARR